MFGRLILNILSTETYDIKKLHIGCVWLLNRKALAIGVYFWQQVFAAALQPSLLFRGNVLPYCNNNDTLALQFIQ